MATRAVNDTVNKVGNAPITPPKNLMHSPIIPIIDMIQEITEESISYIKVKKDDI